MLVGIEKPETIVVWLPVLFVCLFHVSKECFHHRHALVDASLVCVAIGSVCERWIRMPQDAGKRYDIRALLYPVGCECVTQCTIPYTPMIIGVWPVLICISLIGLRSEKTPGPIFVWAGSPENSSVRCNRHAWDSCSIPSKKQGRAFLLSPFVDIIRPRFSFSGSSCRS